MDFRRPVEAIIPGVQGRILAVLAEATGEMNLRTVARLACVSSAQASRVLPDLVALGVVERRDVPPSALFALVDEHIAAPLMRGLSRARDTALDRIGSSAELIEPAPVSVVVFGSLARGDADVASDVDMVVVRPEGVDVDDERWVPSLEDWRRSARRLTGNRIQLLEVDQREAARRVRRPNEVWVNVLRDGVVVFGSPLQELRGRPGG